MIGPFVSIRCWSTLPDWDKERWMEIHPSKHLVLINGYTYQGPWYEGDTYISYKYPKALAERWRNYFNNQIVDISHELWKDYHFIGSTDRIHIFGRRPYISAIRNWETGRKLQHCWKSGDWALIIPEWDKRKVR